jgi:Kef-type K+ transport system membrane component KefB
MLAEIVSVMAEIGILLLMFLAGLETDLDEMRRVGAAAFSGGIGGVVFPFLAGAYTAHAFGYSFSQSIFVGTILTATSVSISAQTLIELGKIRTKEGTTILGAAVIDDILGIILVSVVVAFYGTSGAAHSGSIGFLLLRMVAYFGVVLALGWFFLGRFTRWVEDRISASEAVFALALVVIFGFSWSAEALGSVATITGAYIAGLLYAKTEFSHTLEEKVQSMAYGLFVPVFFISIGLEANARTIGGSLLFAALIVIGSILTKVLGVGISTFAVGFKPREALRVGTGMISRGEVGLIVAGIGLSSGVITQGVFSVMAIMVLITTMVTPPLLRIFFRPDDAEARAQAEEATAND